VQLQGISLIKLPFRASGLGGLPPEENRILNGARIRGFLRRGRGQHSLFLRFGKLRAGPEVVVSVRRLNRL
jgi:hypothetical protein